MLFGASCDRPIKNEEPFLYILLKPKKPSITWLLPVRVTAYIFTHSGRLLRVLRLRSGAFGSCGRQRGWRALRSMIATRVRIFSLFKNENFII